VDQEVGHLGRVATLRRIIRVWVNPSAGGSPGRLTVKNTQS
jgi:hypothetical protein